MMQKGFRPLFAFIAKVDGNNKLSVLREQGKANVLQSKAYAKFKKLLSRM